jgi:hypothetical protein
MVDDEDKKNKKKPQKALATGKAAGGVARDKALSPERKREIAAKGAAARWGDKPVRVTHRGNFKEQFGIDVECYVLDDEHKTALISKRGMGAALGMGVSGSVFTTFINGKRLAPYVGSQLAQKLANPLIFQAMDSGGSTLPTPAHGYDATILIDVCNAITKAAAAGALSGQYDHIVAQATVIVNASAKAGIKNLVYALAGYDATREEIVRAFKFYVQEEARAYEREFPEQLYAEWHRLYELTPPERGRPWKFKDLTIKQVYTPLARSNGKILELTRTQRENSEERHKKLHQFLSEIGVKALRTHLGRLLGMAEASKTREEYEAHVKRVFNVQLELPI